MVSDVLWDGDEFCKGTLAAEFVAGDTEDLAVLAQVDRAFAAVVAFATRDGRIESHSVADFEALDVSTDVLDNPGGFVTHDQWGDASTGATIKAVDIASTDPACFDLHQQIRRSAGGDWHFDDLEFFDFREQQSLHDFNPFCWLSSLLGALERWFL
jgi:hypothetical protein